MYIYKAETVLSAVSYVYIYVYICIYIICTMENVLPFSTLY